MTSPSPDLARFAVAAIQSGNRESLRELLAEGLDPNVRLSRTHRSLLHVATTKVDGWAVEDLLNAGAKPRPLKGENDEIRHPQLSTLCVQSGQGLEQWKVFEAHDARLSASWPQEMDPPMEGHACQSNFLWTPLASVLTHVPEEPIFAAPAFEGLAPEWANTQKGCRAAIEYLSQKPGEWCPESTQAVFHGAVTSCHASALPELEQRFGLSIADIPRPTEVLNQVLTMLKVFPRAIQDTDRYMGWLESLAKRGARWEDTTNHRNGDVNFPELRAQFKEWRLEATLPQARSCGPKPRL